jgi:hypothetical protein
MKVVKDSTVTTPATETADEVDIGKLRLSQEFLETAGAKKLLTTVPVRKPRKQDWNFVHPSPEFRGPYAVIELKDDQERYLITPEIAAALPEEIQMEEIYTAINRQGVVFLWPVRLPLKDNRRRNEFHRTLEIGAVKCMSDWHRVVANMSLGGYVITQSPRKYPAPEWPAYTFIDLLRVGFRDRIINSLDHPILKRLRGEC